MNFKDVILGSDPLDLKVQRVSDLFETDDFLLEVLYSPDFLDIYVPFSVLVLNSVEAERSPPYTPRNEVRTFILTSLNKFIFKKVSNSEFVFSLHRVLEEDNLHNAILALKIFASLNKSMDQEMFESHVSVVVGLINSIFLRLEDDSEAETETSFFTLVQIFGYVSDVIQRQPRTENKIEEVIHRAVTFFRLFLEHRRVIDLIKYNKGTALEMISSLSKLFKIASDSLIFMHRNDVLNSTIFELAKFALFYCPTDAVELRKELFYYIFKILLRNKDMFLPKIEEFFDIRFFYLDEAFLINIKGLIGLTDMASVFSDNLSRRIPYELQRRTGEILESNLMMIQEKQGDEQCQEDLMDDEIRLRYEKSVKFHLEIIYECVNLIFKQMAILKKFAFQKADFVDFCYKQFLMIEQVTEALETLVKGGSMIGEAPDLVPLVKSIFLSLSKPIKEISDGINEILKGNADVPVNEIFLTDRFFPMFESVMGLMEILDFDEKDSPYLNEILIFFFTPFKGSDFVDIINRIISQMFKIPKTLRIFLDVLKNTNRPNLHFQIVVNELVVRLVKTMLSQEDDLKKAIYHFSYPSLSYAEMVGLYEPIFDFIADIYNYNPGFLSKKSMYSLVNFLNQMISSRDMEDHKLLLYLLGTFNIKNDKSGSLHVFFYKKLHIFVRDFYNFYTLTLDPLYLDIIFSFPININAVASEWGFLLGPIRSALKLRDEISVKAISTFIHIIEASKGDVYKVESLFSDIFDLLNDKRFIISCSQLLGRLKSYHKKHLAPSFFFFDNSFGSNHSFLVPQGNFSDKIPMDGVVIKAIEFLRGTPVMDPNRLVYDLNKVVIFKKNLLEPRRDPKDVEMAYQILKGFVFGLMGWDSYGKDGIINRATSLLRDMMMEGRSHHKHFGYTDIDHYIANALEIPFGDQLAKSQYIYDSILALLLCPDQEKVFVFLQDIFECVAVFNFLMIFYYPKNVAKVLLNGNIFIKALLEGFGEDPHDFVTRVFHSLLDKYVEVTGSVEDLYEYQIIPEILVYLFRLSESRNEKMTRASFNGLNAFLLWERLPSGFISGDLKRILDTLLSYAGRKKAFKKEMLVGINFLINRKDTLSCISFIFKWCIDNIIFNSSNKVERVFCREVLKLLFLRYGKLFVAMFTEKLKGFFYALSDLRDIDVFFTKVDLFIFFVRHTRLFSEKETVVFVKAFFYYILSCNFFIFNVSQETYLTNLAITSSKKFKEWEKESLKRSDLIRHLFYDLSFSNPDFYDVFDCSLSLPVDVNEDERYYYYLVNEIIYMHLAFMKNKDEVPFDFAFRSLPFGLALPLKRLYLANGPLVEELLRDKYEECFNSTLSVQVVEKMLTIFSVIEMKEDEKLLNFILKIFSECQTQVESLLFAEDPESSIFAKTFELSLKYPNQTQLHSSILMVAYPWLYNSSKSYISSISNALLDFIEQHSYLCFPLMVRECVNEPIFYLVKFTAENSVSFKNFANNLSQGFIEESLGAIYNQQESQNFWKVQYFLDFLQLIDFDVTQSQISAALMIYSDLKMKNKDTRRIKNFFRFAINRFSENDLNVLFKIDPLLKLNNSCNVKMFKSLSTKSLYGCLLKSINKGDVKSFENLIRFYGDQSWMLIDIFVDVKFHSQSMIEYCKGNLSNVNIRSFLLYYLCTFEPLPEYFELLLNLSFEERKYTLYCLRKVVEKHKDFEGTDFKGTDFEGTDFEGTDFKGTDFKGTDFEETILEFLKSEIRYKTNIHILYPLLAHTPSLITLNIAKELIVIVHRLLNTFVPFHQKIGTLLFDTLYHFYSTTTSNDHTQLGRLKNLYTLLFINFIHSKKSNILPYLKKYNFELDLDAIQLFGESINFGNILSFLEIEISSKKSLQYKTNLSTFLFGISRNDWFKWAVDESTIKFVFDLGLIKENEVPLKEMNRTTLLNYLTVMKKGDVTSLSKKSILSSIKYIFMEGDQENTNNFYQLLLGCHGNYVVDFIVELVGEAKGPNLYLEKIILDLLLGDKINTSQTVSLLSTLSQKSLIPEGDLLNLALNFFMKNRLSKTPITSLNELFYRGCTCSDEIIRQKYIQLLSEILPNDIPDRLIALFGVDWTGCENIPYVLTILLLDCFDTIDIHCNPMYVRGATRTPFLFYDNSPSSKSASMDNSFYFFQENHIRGYIERTRVHEPTNFKNDLFNFLYVSRSACLSLLGELIKPLRDDYKGVLWEMVPEMSEVAGDDLMYVILKALGIPPCILRPSPCKLRPSPCNPCKLRPSLVTGLNTWYYLLDVLPIQEKLCKFREMGIKDYAYGGLRAAAKFPEVMQASVFQQLGYFKEAQVIYEKLQSECCEAKVSFYEDEYEHILREWVDCAKEMQQWDICYNLGKFKGDTTLSADALFYTSNFNVPTERENFLNMVSLMEKGVKKSFYELFYSIYQAPTSESFVALLNIIIKKIYDGPRTKEFNNYYSTLIQVVLEMHDTINLFLFRPDTEERINGLTYAWEDKEPHIESQYETLLLFSTWRRHFFRRVEGYSNEGNFPEMEEPESPSRKPSSLNNSVCNNKEFSETVSKLRKAMYIKGNNGLGRNANFLALAAYKKGYYDNALFLLKEVFELPSIKILDAYRKVVYELMCFYDLGQNRLGLDLANSTNIVHFSDEQSSTIFRIRGMFSEKIEGFEETKKLYFQAIQFFSSAENYFHYSTLLIKHFKIFEDHEDKKVFNDRDVVDEVLSSALQGLSASHSTHSKHLIIQLLLIFKTKKVSFDLSLYKSLVKSTNLAFFVFFIPQLVKLVQSENFEYVKIILEGLVRNYPQAVITQIRVFLGKHPEYSSAFSELVGENYFVDLLTLFDDLNNDKYFKAEHEIIDLLDSLVSSLVALLSSGGEPDPEKIIRSFNRLIQLSEKCEVPLDTFAPKLYIKSSSFNLNEILNFLLCIRRDLKNFIKASHVIEIHEKIDLFNKTISDKKLALFGSFRRISKDYANVVYVESLDSSNLLRKASSCLEIFLIGSDGRYYKYEIWESPSHAHKEGMDLAGLYHVLYSEIRNSYKLKDASHVLFSCEEILHNIHVDVFYSNFWDFENICEIDSIRNKRSSHLVEFVKGCEEQVGIYNDTESDVSTNDIERDILNLLKSKPASNYPLNTASFTIIEVLNLLKDRLMSIKIPRIPHKARLKAFSNVLKPLSPVLKTFFRANSENHFSYFMQRNAFSKSYALNLSLNNCLMTKTKDPENDLVQVHTGLFLRRNLSNVSFGNMSLENNNTLYISPGIQEWIGVENLEGPVLSSLYFSSEIFFKSQTFDLTVLLFYEFGRDPKEPTNFKAMISQMRERLESVIKLDGNDHQIVKLLNEWTDVGVISRNDVLENLWI